MWPFRVLYMYTCCNNKHNILRIGSSERFFHSRSLRKRRALGDRIMAHKIHHDFIAAIRNCLNKDDCLEKRIGRVIASLGCIKLLFFAIQLLGVVPMRFACR